jgi:hypothetical protein
MSDVTYTAWYKCPQGHDNMYIVETHPMVDGQPVCVNCLHKSNEELKASSLQLHNRVVKLSDKLNLVKQAADVLGKAVDVTLASIFEKEPVNAPVVISTKSTTDAEHKTMMLELEQHEKLKAEERTIQLLNDSILRLVRKYYSPKSVFGGRGFLVRPDNITVRGMEDVLSVTGDGFKFDVNHVDQQSMHVDFLKTELSNAQLILKIEEHFKKQIEALPAVAPEG